MEAKEIMAQWSADPQERVDYMNARLRRLTPIETHRPMVGVWVLPQY